ncbi:MAG: UDP-2,3-diacylglucosamine diphosphatase [Balneolaceae bacterium]
MGHLFLSDVHIGAFEDERDQRIQQELISLIHYCEQNHHTLHILGDLFDYWMEYPSWHPPLGHKVLNTLSAHMKGNGPINYITGNHDNWTKGYFEKLGFNVSSEFFDLVIDNKRFFLQHGDGLQDPKYGLNRPFMHRILRNNYFIKLYQFVLPPSFGIKAMQIFSNFSKQRAYCDPSVLDRWAEQFLSRTGVDYVICGHDHLPRVLEFTSGTYINLGTFFHHKTVGLYTNGNLQLVVWNAEQQTLCPFENRYKKAVNT